MPSEQISHSCEYFLGFSSFISMISGAIQPMVPHLLQMYSSFDLAASPKSPKTHWSSSFLQIMFSGLMSRCMMCFESRQLRPDKQSWMIFETNQPVCTLLFFIVSYKVPPERYQVTTYIRLSVQYSPSYLIKLGWSISLNVLISFSSASFPLNQIFCPSYENTLAAFFTLVYLCSMRQTVAKVPLPSRFKGLQNQLKPLWEMQCFSFEYSFSVSETFLHRNIAYDCFWLSYKLISSTKVLPCFSVKNGTILQLLTSVYISFSQLKQISFLSNGRYALKLYVLASYRIQMSMELWLRVTVDSSLVRNLERACSIRVGQVGWEIENINQSMEYENFI